MIIIIIIYYKNSDCKLKKLMLNLIVNTVKIYYVLKCKLLNNYIIRYLFYFTF